MELDNNIVDKNLLEFLISKEQKSNELSKSKIISDTQKINFEIKEAVNDYYVPKANWKTSGFLSGEQWGEPLNIQSQIIKIDKKTVTCNCAMDIGQNIFQTRIFPKILFEHLEKIQVSDLVLVVIKEKKGSSRIDIMDGRFGVVDSAIFERKNKWNKLKESTRFNNPIEGGIEL
jgi:hypothetical protein